MNRKLLLVWLVLGVAAAYVLAATFRARLSAEKRLAFEVQAARQEAERIQTQVVLFTERVVAPGWTFSDFLQGMGLDRLTVFNIVQSAQPVFDLRHVRAGHLLAVGRSVLGELRAVRYHIDADRMLWIAPRDREFHAEIKAIPSSTQIARVTGEIRDSLFEAVSRAGEGPELALRLADIFGWDLDFYTDPRPRDTFGVVLEKKTYQNGQPPTYGRILAAEYNNQGRAYRAVLFHDPSGKPAYYAADGQALQKAFLRSPLKFGAPVTSHFSLHRFHPILKHSRPHLGIDYAAPEGTPVQSIGDGRVVFAGRKGGSGNMVQVQHANSFETFYLHLSRLLVRPGQRVAQGQRIGLVGATGLATGPHLDFRIRQGGAFRNFETLRLPPAQPVAKSDLAEFAAVRDRWLPLLPATNALEVRASDQRLPASSQ